MVYVDDTTVPSGSQEASGGPINTLKELPFPPLTKKHILACSYQNWYPVFRSHTPRARIIELPRTFTAYLRADGILLPPSNPSTPRPGSPNRRAVREQALAIDDDEGFFSSSQAASGASSPGDSSSQTSDTSNSELDSDSDSDGDPSSAWPETHHQIRATIRELGGAVVPKLNWSAPKDATWISATNSLECRSPNDIYLLLKSSDFVTHDLEHPLDGCVDFLPAQPPSASNGDSSCSQPHPTHHDLSPAQKIRLLESEVSYVLVLRKHFRINPSLEFRLFVRNNVPLGLTQRDLNHFDFLFSLRPKLKRLILKFWEDEINGKFGEDSYAMDVYCPPPYERCWVVDFNPWDRRTDPGLWSWLELLTMPDPEPIDGAGDAAGDVVRLSLNGHGEEDTRVNEDEGPSEGEESDEDEAEDEIGGLQDSPGPEFRLVQRDDPEAYMFNSTRYSAHKLPREVVDASQGGAGGLREFAEQWKDVLERRSRQANDAGSESDDD